MAILLEAALDRPFRCCYSGDKAVCVKEPVMPALGRPRQEDPELEGYIVIKASLFCV